MRSAGAARELTDGSLGMQAYFRKGGHVQRAGQVGACVVGVSSLCEVVRQCEVAWICRRSVRPPERTAGRDHWCGRGGRTSKVAWGRGVAPMAERPK